MTLLRRLVLVGVAIAVVAPAAALGANCRLTESVKQKLDDSQVAFVGRVVAVSPEPGSGGVPFFDYRFTVDRAVKGLNATRVTVRATKLVDLDNQVVTPSEVTIGVLATKRPGGVLVTNSCALVDPGSLMGASDEPKGGPIKVVIGLLLLGLVVWYSLRRLKRRREAEVGSDPKV